MSHLHCQGQNTDLLRDAKDERLTCSGMLAVLSYPKEAEVCV